MLKYEIGYFLLVWKLNKYFETLSEIVLIYFIISLNHVFLLQYFNT